MSSSSPQVTTMVTTTPSISPASSSLSFPPPPPPPSTITLSPSPSTATTISSTSPSSTFTTSSTSPSSTFTTSSTSPSSSSSSTSPYTTTSLASPTSSSFLPPPSTFITSLTSPSSTFTTPSTSPSSTFVTSPTSPSSTFITPSTSSSSSSGYTSSSSHTSVSIGTTITPPPVTSTPLSSPSPSPPLSPSPSSSQSPSDPPLPSSPQSSQPFSSPLSSLTSPNPPQQSYSPPSTSSVSYTRFPQVATSTILTTYIGISDGQLYTTTFVIQTITVPVGPTSGPAPSVSLKSNKIVGGVVGGVAGLVLLLLILLLLRNHCLRATQNVDRNFDFVHAPRNPNLTLDDPEGNDGGRLGSISPFPYDMSESRRASLVDMQHYHPTDRPTVSYPSSEGGSGSGSGHSASHYANIPPVDPHFVHQGAQYLNVDIYSQPQPQAGVGRGPSQSSSHESHATRASTASGSGLWTGATTRTGTVPRGRRMSAKEREVFLTRSLSWHDRPQAVPPSFGVGRPGSDVVGSAAGPAGIGVVDREAYLRNGPGLIVHQDAGRVREGEHGGVEERTREENPPTYDSLPVGERQ